MIPNPILSKMSKVENEFFEWYKEFVPSSAYTDGASECAGKFFVPSQQNLLVAEKKLKNILKEAQKKFKRVVVAEDLMSIKI